MLNIVQKSNFKFLKFLFITFYIISNLYIFYIDFNKLYLNELNTKCCLSIQFLFIIIFNCLIFLIFLLKFQFK